MSDVFDVTATFRVRDGKATITFEGRHPASVELTDAERQTIEDLLIGITARREGGRHG